MRGIPEDKAIEIGEQIDSCKYLECSVKEWLRDECKELNPWIPIDAFLKSKFDEIDCWVITNKEWELAKFNGEDFCSHDDYPNQIYFIEHITGVQPIHKPEPPR